VVVSGAKDDRFYEHRHCCIFPSLYQLRQMLWISTPVAFAAAQCAAAFVERFPTDLAGVYPPEGLPKPVRDAVLRAMTRRRGFRFNHSVAEVGTSTEGHSRHDT
jgi:hypothetical protein